MSIFWGSFGGSAAGVLVLAILAFAFSPPMALKTDIERGWMARDGQVYIIRPAQVTEATP